ncbi:MAG: alanine racemase [Alkalispirochaetaceae bacterium]
MAQLPERKTRAEVDLDALSYNISLLRERAGGTPVLLPVKADAYGHGQIAVAGRAVAEGVAFLAVANAQELERLRDADISHPTLILEDLFPDELDWAVRDREARFNVSSVSYAEKLAHVSGGDRKVRVHVNLDTGMGRMGLLAPDPVEAILRISELPGIQIEGVFSHFPAADEEDVSFARKQIADFSETLEKLEQRGVSPRYRHISNSAGIMVFGEEGAFDLIRPGVSAYGMFPSPEVAEKVGASIPLRACMRVLSAIVKITEYDRPWTVGYGRSYSVGPGSRIAVIPVGYGDGYRRALSNGIGVAVVHGQRVPVVGRVSMDMITLDLTNLEEPAEIGDEVVLLGEQEWKGRRASVFAEEMAKQVGTISYEITCGFTARVPRLY